MCIMMTDYILNKYFAWCEDEQRQSIRELLSSFIFRFIFKVNSNGDTARQGFNRRLKR